MSYTIEVYRRKPGSRKKIWYIFFIRDVLPSIGGAGLLKDRKTCFTSFMKNMNLTTIRVSNGLKQMVWGFFKKLVIADRLALYVNAVYDNPAQHTGTTLLLATVFFAIQIYCDFSAYSDIAIGCARVMGFKLMTNFNRPYFSTSIAEFWKRWHISLSTWFRDYLYISLGGNRVAIPRWYLNLFIVFLVSGYGTEPIGHILYGVGLMVFT